MQEDTAATEVHNLAGGADKLVASPSHHLASIRILKSVPPGTNIFKRGENARKGDELLAAGRQLDPAGVAVCAAVGRRQVSVYRRPVVNILSSGTELLDEQDDNSHAHPHQVRNSNGPFLRAAVIAQSFNVGGCETIADEPERIATALRHAADKSDVIVISGGVSVGKYDLVPEAIIKAGGMIHYHGIAMKPGKPQLFASLAGRGSSRTGNSLIFGLPGNPLSAMTGFHEFILPALRRLAGCPVAQCRPAMTVRLAQVLEVKGDRHQLAPATLTWNGGGAEAVLVEASGSADLVAGAKADGVLIIPAGPRHIPAGSLMEFRSWRILQ
jgi:molybdopterin molybdotransferase